MGNGLDYEIAVIGGGPTGATIAAYLAKGGKKVVVFEKDNFPRDHVGETLVPWLYYIFEELDLLDDMNRLFEKKPGARFNSLHGEHHFTNNFADYVKGPAAVSWHVFRPTFDKLLLDRAKALGATVFENSRVTKIDLTIGNKVTLTTLTDGTHLDISANFLVDASGLSAVLAKLMGTRKLVEGYDKIAFACHWLDAKPIHGIEEGLFNLFHLNNEDKQGWAWVLPVGPNRVGVGVVLDSAYVKKSKARMGDDKTDFAKQFYLNELYKSDKIREILEPAKMAMEVVVCSDYSYMSGKGYGSNFAMVGDAYKFLDPIFATGILMGMKSAELIAKALLTDDAKKMEEAFVRIEGAYVLIEKFINSFYDPGTLDFYALDGLATGNFEKQESAYRLVVGLLAGDIFDRPVVYSDFFESLKGEKQLSRYYNLVHKSKGHAKNFVNEAH